MKSSGEWKRWAKAWSSSKSVTASAFRGWVGRAGSAVFCPAFPYSILWEERSVCSVANLTRRDGEEFLALAPLVPVRTEIETFPLAEANEVLARLRGGKLRGAAVLTMS